MSAFNTTKSLGKLQIDVASISDPDISKTLNGLLNLIETLHAENEGLKKENQPLKDEINTLKGEQGKPNIKGNSANKPSDH